MSIRNQTSRGSVLEKAKRFESVSKSSEDNGSNEAKEETTNESEDDNIDFAELVRNISGGNQESGERRGEALKEAFKILDHDEDGFISVADMIIALETFDDDEDEESTNPKEGDDEGTTELLAKEMIEEGDFDGDGKISFDDFIRVLQDDEVEPVDESIEKKKKRKKKSHK